MATDEKSPRRCSETRRDGRPCGAAPLRGEEFCFSHIPDDHPKSTLSNRFKRGNTIGVQTRFKPGNPGGPGGQRIPRYHELMQARIEHAVEAHLAKVFDGLFGALDATLFGESRDGEIVPTAIPDVNSRQRAALAILERLLGRPVQPAQLSADPDGITIRLAFDPRRSTDGEDEDDDGDVDDGDDGIGGVREPRRPRGGPPTLPPGRVDGPREG